MKNPFKKQEIKTEIISEQNKGQLTETPFHIIQQSEILTRDDLNLLNPLKGELKETFKI